MVFGRDAFEHRNPLFQPADLPRQLGVVIGQQGDFSISVGVGSMNRAAPFILNGIAVLGADPRGEHPAADRQSDDSEDKSGATEIHVSSSLLPFPREARSAESVDLVREAAVVARIILLDVSKPAVDVAEARLDVAGRCGRVAAHTLPEFRFLARTIERERLGRAHPGDHPVSDQRPGEAAHQGQEDRADADPEDVDPAIIRDPGAHTAPFAVLLVEVEFVRLADISVPPAIVFELRQFFIAAYRGAEVGMVGADDAFDGVQAVFEPSCRIIEFVEQLFVFSGQRLGLLPLRDVVEDQPRQTEEEGSDDDRDDDDLFHRPCPMYSALI
eukprot:Opistho-2@68417